MWAVLCCLQAKYKQALVTNLDLRPLTNPVWRAFLKWVTACITVDSGILRLWATPIIWFLALSIVIALLFPECPYRPREIVPWSAFRKEPWTVAAPEELSPKESSLTICVPSLTLPQLVQATSVELMVSSWPPHTVHLAILRFERLSLGLMVELKQRAKVLSFKVFGKREWAEWRAK